MHSLGGFGINAHIDARERPDSMGRYVNDNFDKSRLNSRFVKIKEAKKAILVATRNIKV